MKFGSQENFIRYFSIHVSDNSKTGGRVRPYFPQGDFGWSKLIET